MYHRVIYYVLLISLGLCQGSLRADTELIYTSQTNKVFGSPTIIQIQGSKVRMEHSGDNLYLLYDHDTQTLISVNPKTQHYVVNTLDTIRLSTQRLVSMQQEFVHNLKKQIQDLPESQRATALKRLEQAEKMLKIPQPKLTVDYDSKTDLILGKPCKIAYFKIRTQLIRTLCYAPHRVIEPRDFRRLKSMFNFMNQLSQEIARIQEQPPSSINLTSMVFDEGLVLSSHNVVQNTLEELAEIKTAPLNPQLFTIPSDYTELDANSALHSTTHFTP